MGGSHSNISVVLADISRPSRLWMILSHTIQVKLSLLGRKNCPQTRSLGLYKQNPPARVLRESAQADFGFVAAISNRLVLLLLRKGELLQYSSAPAPVPVASEQSKLFQPDVVPVFLCELSPAVLAGFHKVILP